MEPRTPEPPPLRRQAGHVTFLGSFPEAPPATGLPEVAFAGRSNVGKSSALNRLLNRRAARVSGTPGRTQLLNLFRVGQGAVLVDLPGYGFARVPEHVLRAWGPMIEGYLGTRAELRLVVVLVDGSLPAQPIDTALLDGLREVGLPVVVVATKLDKLSKHQRKPALAALAEAHGVERDSVVGFSARTGEGVEALWDVIEAACAAEAPR